MSEPRIPPLPRDEWSPELTTFIADFQATVRSDRRRTPGPNGANLLGTLAGYPALTKAFLTFNGHFLYGTSLSARQRELLILRVARVRHCDYEWAQHVFQGQVAGLEPEEITRVADGPDAPGWTSIDRALIKAADEFLADGTVGDETWKVLAGEFDERQLMDVVFTMGTYEMLAKAMLCLGIQLDDDLIPFLPEQPANGATP